MAAHPGSPMVLILLVQEGAPDTTSMKRTFFSCLQAKGALGQPTGKSDGGGDGGAGRGGRTESWAPPDLGSAHPAERALYRVESPRPPLRSGRQHFSVYRVHNRSGPTSHFSPVRFPDRRYLWGRRGKVPPTPIARLCTRLHRVAGPRSVAQNHHPLQLVDVPPLAVDVLMCISLGFIDEEMRADEVCLATGQHASMQSAIRFPSRSDQQA